MTATKLPAQSNQMTRQPVPADALHKHYAELAGFCAEVEAPVTLAALVGLG